MNTDNHQTGTLDKRQRPLRDLRISLTDHCNLRCLYCMPPDKSYQFFPKEELLSRAEIVRLAKIYYDLGVRRIRLTGGEPLLRHDVCEIISDLNQLPFEDISLTTNGMLLEKKAQDLKKAGLKRVTVSLDALDEKTLDMASGGKANLAKILAGIKAAQSSGLTPVKVNCVIQKDFNDDQIIPLAQFAKDENLSLRFIEYMDVGNVNGWNMKRVVPSKDVLAQLREKFDLHEKDSRFYGEVANHYRFGDSDAEIGFISSVTQAFCSTCTRSRLSADGKIYNCLFASKGVDLKQALRDNADDTAIADLIRGFWSVRTNQYSVERESESKRRDIIEMFQIGG